MLPGATATEFWATGGLPVEHLDANIVMGAEEMVDAALVGFDRGEVITIPSLPHLQHWQAYEDARQKMMPNLSRNKVADRYRAEV